MPDDCDLLVPTLPANKLRRSLRIRLTGARELLCGAQPDIPPNLGFIARPCGQRSCWTDVKHDLVRVGDYSAVVLDHHYRIAGLHQG